MRENLTDSNRRLGRMGMRSRATACARNEEDGLIHFIAVGEVDGNVIPVYVLIRMLNFDYIWYMSVCGVNIDKEN